MRSGMTECIPDGKHEANVALVLRDARVTPRVALLESANSIQRRVRIPCWRTRTSSIRGRRLAVLRE